MLTPTASNSSHLHYIPQTVSQRQATVKFHGVFASHWKSLAFTPGRSFRETLVRDSGDLVTPFMQAGIQPARYYAHFVTNPFSRIGSDISANLTTSLLCSDCILQTDWFVLAFQSLRILLLEKSFLLIIFPVSFLDKLFVTK